MRLIGLGLLFFFIFKIAYPEEISPNNLFTENKGQIVDQINMPNPGVLYLLNTPGFNVQLRRGGFSYDLYRLSNHAHQTSNFESPSSLQFHRIDLDLVGANLKCKVTTTGSSPDYLNYYTSGTPSEGVTGVQSYKTVTYIDIYPGIDLEFNTSDEIAFEYNFIIRPGSDPSMIRIKVSGPIKSRPFSDGIRYYTSIGMVEETIPYCFYQVNSTNFPVKGMFVRIAENTYGFVMDQTIPPGAMIVIDPIPTRKWGTYYGGSPWYTSSAITEKSCNVDSQGNIFIAGSTNSTNNMATAGAYQGALSGLTDAFVVKFLPNGQRQWGTYYGGDQEDAATCCCASSDTTIVIAGWTNSTNNIASPGAFQMVRRGNKDAMLVKFNSFGQRLWGTYYGGNENDPWGEDIIKSCNIDNSGNIYCAGVTGAPDFIASPVAHQTTIGGMFDDYLVKFNSDGQRLWGTYYGGTNIEERASCTVVNSGFVFISGNTNSPNNISTPGSFMPSYNGFQKGYLAAFNLDGQRLWGTYYAGESTEDNYGCTNDSAGSVYIYGTTSSTTNIATPGTFQQTQLGIGGNAYLAKFSTDGQRQWGTYYGVNWTWITGAAVDDSSNIFVTGYTNDQNTVIASPGAFQSVNRGNNDAFLGKFSSSCYRYWGTYYGGTAQDQGLSCAVDFNDNIYLCGNTWSENNTDHDTSLCTRSNSNNFIATPGAFETERRGISDVFLVKFSDCYSPDTAQLIYGPIVVCASTGGLTYSIDPIYGATDYHWCVSNNLTIIAGQQSTSITVNVGPQSGTDTISVYGINSCDNGYPISLLITVVPRPVPVITGTDTICTGDTGIFYTNSGMINYTWTVSPGGTVVSGGTTADTTISVTWSSGGYHWVGLAFTSNGCQSLQPTQKDVWVVAGPLVSITISPMANPVCPGTSVIFTAVPVNEGTSPVYQWIVNGINVGTSSLSYTYTPVTGDLVQCILTSNLDCASGNPATSNTVTMVVNPILPVSISVTASANSVCAGTSVTFTAVPTNGGSNPLFQWKVNGINVGMNNPTYIYIPFNGDFVECTLTSSELCTSGNPAFSLPITMVVIPNLPVSVSVTPSSNPFCLGTPVTFSATAVNGGSNPSYQWLVNGINVGTNNPIITYIPVSLDLVSCILTSSIPDCITNNPDTSAAITMIGFPGLPADVTITAVPSPSCQGIPVTFTATPVNGGSSPSFQWQVNGINVGTNSPVYSYIPSLSDSIRCIMTSNLPCVSNNPVFSPQSSVSISPTPAVTFTPCFDTMTTTNAKPIKLKGGIPLGGSYSGPGVSGGYFYPNLAGVGTHVITYTYVNAALCSNSTTSRVHEFTNPIFNCGNNWIDIRDGKSYPTIQIGSQCWFAADLNFGTEIPPTLHQRDNCIIEKYFNPASSIQHPASVYQWDELMRYDPTPASQGLCPPGWHVPTEAEWATLFANWTNNAFAASPLKYSGYSGFNAFLSGARHETVQWDYQNFAAFFWSSTAYGPFKAWAHGMNDPDPSVSYYPSLRSNAFSVRCLRD